MDSLSMTPPLSPVGFTLEELQAASPENNQFKVIEEDEGRTICFNCFGNATLSDRFQEDSYWKSGFISRVFAEKVVSKVTDGDSVELFTFNWEQNSVLTDELHQLFLLIRQHVGEIQSYATNSSILRDSFEVLRLQIVGTLDIIWKCFNCNPGLPVQQLEDVVSQLHGLIVYIGRWTELFPSRNTSWQQENRTKTGAYQSFHLHLDIYWRLLVMIYTVERNYPNFYYSRRLMQGAELDTPLFDQLVHHVMWDLVMMACQEYKKQITNTDYTKVSLFSCPCVKEMWLLLLKLLEFRTQKHGTQSFWISLHQILKVLMSERDDSTDMENEIDSDVFTTPTNLPSSQNAISICQWIISQVAPLFKVKSPDPLSETRAQSNYYDLEILMKKYIALSPLPPCLKNILIPRTLEEHTESEATLRHHLKTCLSLSSLWEPNPGIVGVLWEYFYHRLNGTFQLNPSGVEGLASVVQSAVGLFNQCKLLTTGQYIRERETSFQLFLRLLALQLGRLYSAGSTLEWKQIKGRIYSKFHQRRIQTLGEGGLSNLTSLFLTLAMTTDLEDVASKLCDFYDMLDSSKITFGKRSVIWRGAFSLILIYVEKSLDISFLADKLTKAFDNAVSDYDSAGIDTRHSLWKLLLLYLEGTQEVFESSQGLQLSEYKLIGSSWKSLMSVCSENELRQVLTVLVTIIHRFKHIYGEWALKTPSGQVATKHTDIADALWINVYPFIRDHSMTLTPPPQLAELASAFCLLALKFCPGIPLGTRDNFTSIFTYFALGDSTNVSLSCRFLSQILSSSDAIESLEKDLPNYQTLLIKAWFRCALHVPGNSQMLVEVTRTVMQLEQVRSTLNMAEVEIAHNPDTAPVFFLKAIERAHRKIQSWKDRMEFRNQVMTYFSDVSKHVAMVIRNPGPSEAFSNVYKMTGYLVKYCAPLLFVESKPDCPLPSIINGLIVPHHVLNPDKPLHSSFLTAIRETLHMFIQGLGKLDYKKSPYVQRRLKDIVTVYLPKFSLKSSSAASVATSVHPIVASLSSSYIQQVSDEAMRFREFILQLVINNFVQVKNMAVHPLHTMGIALLHEVLQRSTNKEVIARDTALLLPSCLDYLLLLPELSASLSPITNILSTLLEAYQFNTHVVSFSRLTEACEKFIQTFFVFNNQGVLQVMEKLAILQTDLVISVIKKLSSCVVQMEAKRGVAVDKTLRQKYCKVLKRLGPVGEAEILEMQSQST